jgi:hypothetical protein
LRIGITTDHRMPETHCPICYTALETREVAPCDACGHIARELTELAEGLHTYDEVETLGARIVLCDFCQSDFSSFDPTYFGRPTGTPLGRPHIRFMRTIRDPRPSVDKFCPQCEQRLAFLRFVVQTRDVAGR